MAHHRNILKYGCPLLIMTYLIAYPGFTRRFALLYFGTTTCTLTILQDTIFSNRVIYIITTSNKRCVSKEPSMNHRMLKNDRF